MKQPKKFNAEPYGYHEEVDLRVETLTNLGMGLGRDGGWVVMVPFVLPGELVRVRIYRNCSNYSEGDLLEVLEASEDRVEARCGLFGECGGCQYQHIGYGAQKKWKRQQVMEVLERIGGLKDVEVGEVVGSSREYGYRSKLTPHFKKPRAGEELKVGFLKQGMRHHLVDVPECPIAMEGINGVLLEERRKVKSGERKFKKGGTLLLRETPEGVVTDPKAVVRERVGDLEFEFIAGEFFQNNPYILSEMVEYVVEQVKGEGVRNLIDAYCGVGVFGLSGAVGFEEVLGVEVSERAVGFARRNAELNGIKNAGFVSGEAERIFEGVEFVGEETSMVLDPPRRGCDEVFLKQLVEFGPKRVVYVSCDPATQARDFKFLVGCGYVVEGVVPFDLFPQTRHIESVATLRRG